jgi:hypothetical protein
MATVTDDFNRANGALGANWTTFRNALTITSNQVFATGSLNDCDALWNGTPIGTANHYAQITGTLAANSSVDVFVRASDSSNFCYGQWSAFDGNYHIFEVVAGTETDLDSAAAPGAFSTVTLKIVASGSTYELFADGVSVCTAASTLTVGSIGFGSAKYDGTSTLDNFEGGDVVGGAAFDPPAPLWSYRSSIIRR